MFVHLVLLFVCVCVAHWVCPRNSFNELSFTSLHFASRLRIQNVIVARSVQHGELELAVLRTEDMLHQLATLEFMSVQILHAHGDAKCFGQRQNLHHGAFLPHRLDLGPAKRRDVDVTTFHVGQKPIGIALEIRRREHPHVPCAVLAGVILLVQLDLQLLRRGQLVLLYGFEQFHQRLVEHVDGVLVVSAHVHHELVGFLGILCHAIQFIGIGRVHEMLAQTEEECAVVAVAITSHRANMLIRSIQLIDAQQKELG
mmetsp:Transcript_19250/g.53497  ORF Transcript_19250/g.53497 Transcript_19250/m.53497 type:complete len:256 (+) Transcript_19250:742-1509(+)